MGNGITLAKSLLWDDDISYISIHLYLIFNCGDTLHDEFYPSCIEAHLQHHFTKKFPFDSIVRLTHIKFDCSQSLASIYFSLQEVC